jgi:hypothetical protein
MLEEIWELGFRISDLVGYGANPKSQFPIPNSEYGRLERDKEAKDGCSDGRNGRGEGGTGRSGGGRVGG